MRSCPIARAPRPPRRPSAAPPRACHGQRLLAHELRQTDLDRLVGDLVRRVAAPAPRAAGRREVAAAGHAAAARPRPARSRPTRPSARRPVAGRPAVAQARRSCSRRRSGPGALAHLVLVDERVAAAHARPRRPRPARRVDPLDAVADQLVQPRAEERPRLVEARRVGEDDLVRRRSTGRRGSSRRVVCGLSETIATFAPTRAFTSVDLPTFGRPDHGHDARPEPSFGCVTSAEVVRRVRTRAAAVRSAATRPARRCPTRPMTVIVGAELVQHLAARRRRAASAPSAPRSRRPPRRSTARPAVDGRRRPRCARRTPTAGTRRSRRSRRRRPPASARTAAPTVKPEYGAYACSRSIASRAAASRSSTRSVGALIGSPSCSSVVGSGSSLRRDQDLRDAAALRPPPP